MAKIKAFLSRFLSWAQTGMTSEAPSEALETSQMDVTPVADGPSLWVGEELPEFLRRRHHASIHAQQLAVHFPAPICWLISQWLCKENVTTVASNQGTVAAVNVVFRNESSAPATLIWLDWEGKRVPYMEVYPYCEFLQPTYVGHPWIAESNTGQPLLINDEFFYFPHESTSPALITDLLVLQAEGEEEEGEGDEEGETSKPPLIDVGYGPGLVNVHPSCQETG